MLTVNLFYGVCLPAWFKKIAIVELIQNTESPVTVLHFK